MGQLPITKSSANYIFEIHYNSMLEYLHAIILEEGYKVLNHKCIAYYLKEKQKREDIFRKFEKCRLKRNALLYYGKTMDFEIAKEAIKKSKEIAHL